MERAASKQQKGASSNNIRTVGTVRNSVTESRLSAMTDRLQHQNHELRRMFFL